MYLSLYYVGFYDVNSKAMPTNDMQNKNTHGAKRGEANQKQQLSDYEYIATYTCD